MKRRLTLIVAILVVVGGIVGGVLYYHRQGTAQRMLARIHLELRASHFDKARDLADQYVAKHGDDWRGYHAQAEVLMAMGRHQDARKPLEKLLATPSLGADPLVITVMLAETYSREGRSKVEAQPSSVPALQEALVRMAKADELLAALNVQPTGAGDKKAMDVLAATGINLAESSAIQTELADVYAREAEVAGVGGATETAELNLTESRKLRELAAQTQAKAAESLLRLVTLDPTRQLPAQWLVQLCIQRQDMESLNAVRQAMAKADKPAPIAELMLLQYDVGASAGRDTAEVYRRTLMDACKQLDAMLTRTDLAPEDALMIKLTRAKVALELEDFATAQRLLDEDILKANPHFAEARLTKAKMLMMQGRNKEAERIMFALKTDAPGSIKIQYWHARAAMMAGMTDTAMTTMRNIVDTVKDSSRLDEDDRQSLAMARRYTTTALLRASLYERAFLDAKEYHQDFPTDSSALRLMVQAAAGMVQAQPSSQAKPMLDRAVLDIAVERNPTSPSMLMAARDGYLLLGDPSAAAASARQALAGECRTADDRRSRAAAMWASGDRQQAEDYLLSELARSPNQPELQTAVGYLCSQSGRRLQAIEHFRAALALDPTNEESAFVLARELYAAGDAEQAYQVLAPISIRSSEAERLMAVIQARRGQAPTSQGVAGTSGTRSLMEVAREYLRSGQVQQAVDICNRELENPQTPNARDSHAILARAREIMGQWPQAAEHWAKVIELDPAGTTGGDPLAAYRAMAGALIHELPLEKVAERMSQVPRAQKELLGMTEGWLHMQSRRFPEAAEAYGRLADDESVPKDMRILARLGRIEALANAGQTDQAMSEVEKLKKQEGKWQQVGFARAGVLATARRFDETSSVLDEMCKQAVADGDVDTLSKAAMLYLRIGYPDRAMSACQDAVGLRPQEAGAYLLRAAVADSLGRTQQAIDDYRKAVELQSQSLDIRRRLIAALDSSGRPREALDEAQAMAALGPVGRADSLLARGELLAGWGLQEQALQALDALEADPCYAGVPKVQFMLGRALAAIGRNTEAAKVLVKIPPYADQYYLPAQKLLVLLAGSTDEKLELLRSAARTKGPTVDLLAAEMGILLAADRPAEAVEAFRQQADQLGPNLPMLRDLNYLAIRAMVQAGEVEAAANWCERLARDGGEGAWGQLAVLLYGSGQAERARSLLPDPDKADLTDAMLGVMVAVGSSDADAAAKWGAKAAELADAITRARPANAPAPDRLVLTALASGHKDLLEQQLPKCDTLQPLRRSAIKALADKMSSKADTLAAARLLRATMASEVLPDLAHQWAMEVLRDDPSNQFAALLVVEPMGQGDIEQVRQAAKLLQPADCLVSQYIAASLQMADKEYAKAAESYRRMAEAADGASGFLYMQAEALQEDGKREPALELYRKVYQSSGSPLAANNAAYIISELWPGDPNKLAEARRLIEQAVGAVPRQTSFADTLGWICHLMGDEEQALRYLRSAVKGLSDSPDVHYHLGLAELAGGDAELGRWHLAAAVRLGSLDTPDVTPAAKRVAKRAAEALAKLPTSAPAPQGQ